MTGSRDWQPILATFVERLRFEEHVAFWNDGSHVEVATADRIIQLHPNGRRTDGPHGCEIERTADLSYWGRMVRAEDVLPRLVEAARRHPDSRESLVRLVGMMTDPMTTLRFAADLG